jgi:ankyrin repeat protein
VCLQDKLTNSQLLRHSDQFNVDGEGFTLLMMAARMGSLKSLKLLLKLKGAPVNAQHEKVRAFFGVDN